MIFDFAIVGAGIAGASIAAELAPYATVALVEAEAHPGYHATGRSAAFWEETYGGPAIAPLTRASEAFLDENGFLHRRGAIYVGRDIDRDALDRHIAQHRPAGTRLQRLNRPALVSRLPRLKADWIDGIWQPGCADIDVGGLHAYYLAIARAKGAWLETGARLTSIARSGGLWTLAAQDGRLYHAHQIIDAAGAWAREIAVLADVSPIPIAPYRRTVVQLRTSPAPPADMPLVLDIGGGFYFKPENGKLWLSPHDEAPSAPCDSAPEELAVAEAIARLETVMNWRVDHVERRWAGLRSFAPDRLPIYGRDPREPSFIWCAGQGGFGIQTAPAAASLLARQLIGGAGTVEVGTIDAETFSPARFA
ncbi:MAG: FAD-dependent oxidoreductase [Pontixanthobacter sp.]